jgi:hypothetical protein
MFGWLRTLRLAFRSARERLEDEARWEIAISGFSHVPTAEELEAASRLADIAQRMAEQHAMHPGEALRMAAGATGYVQDKRDAEDGTARLRAGIKQFPSAETMEDAVARLLDKPELWRTVIEQYRRAMLETAE